MVVPGLLRVVGVALLEGGHGQLIPLVALVDLCGLATFDRRDVPGLALDLVLGLPGLEEVGGGDVVVTHAVADEVDDVLWAVGAGEVGDVRAGQRRLDGGRDIGRAGCREVLRCGSRQEDSGK